MSQELNVPFKKVVLPGRVKCGGTEEDIVVAHGCQKRKKVICGPEEEIVVAHVSSVLCLHFLGLGTFRLF